MPWRPHGKARVSPSGPSAFGVCDRCGMWYNLKDLQFQYEWGGSRLTNQNILVCNRCLDIPQQQLRSIIIPADPVPVFNPRPERFREEVPNYRVTQDSNVRVTEDGNYRVTEGGGNG